MPASPQIPLDLAFPAAHTRADFLVAPANRDAVGWVDRWPDWPGPILILEGPPGCGKTHLARIWAARTGAAWIGPEEATTPPEASALAARGTHLALDPLDAWIGTADAETALFHLYNILKENGRSALATLRAPPATVAFTLPDLASRLRAAPMAAIRAPDDDLLSALLVKLFADRRLPVDADVIAYILPRMERSFAAARALVEAADRRALAEKRSLSVPLIRQTMEDLDRIGGL
jgi:chromosomal replication initiation ATPase DnaA